MFRSAAIVLSLPYFHDEAAAFAFLERIVGPHGTVCPKCGVIGQSNEFAPQHGKANKKHPERKIRFGLWESYACRTQFHCESSHAPLRLQLQAEHLLCSSKKGISSQLAPRAWHSTQYRIVHVSPAAQGDARRQTPAARW